jgi:hypothetical protein
MYKKQLIKFIFIGCIISSPLRSLADHPVKVERAFLQQRYFDALVAYRNIPQRRKTQKISRMAVESAWALGLSYDALKEISVIEKNFPAYMISNPDLQMIRAILYYQEGDLEAARKALLVLQESEKADSKLKGEGYTLNAEIAQRFHDYDLAVAYAEKALTFLPKDKQNEARILAATAHYEQGRLAEAKQLLLEVFDDHAEAPRALKLLGKIALIEGQYDQVYNLLHHSRDQYPTLKSDSWISFALAKVAMAKNDEKSLKNILLKTENDFPESETWRILMEAELEKHYRNGQGEQHGK